MANLDIPAMETLVSMMPASRPPGDDREGWIRCKLQAGLPLDPEEKAYLASLPPSDPLLHVEPVARKSTPA